ncbi:TOMM precursor leader peptide-binding protein [Kitasatospora sp. NPDC036755]|uniref:TOMM precursor leader peptide-binding protein n=1 Tax=Kitasatospora sp. NPDC036755 TaxID=3154600 RepID=UPI0033FEDBEF
MTKVHVLALGDFGTAVAERLRRDHDGVVVTSDREGPQQFSARWPRADVRVLASWREAPAVAEALDARSAAWGTPWLPVVAEHPRLRIGPLVVPGKGACYRCFRRRRSQHERDSALTAALHAHYDAHAEAGPGGFLPQHAVLAAGAALDLLRRLEHDAGDKDAGTIRHWHLLEQHLAAARVVGVHGCDRCRRTSTSAGSSWEDLARDLDPWLPVPAALDVHADSITTPPTPARD